MGGRSGQLAGRGYSEITKGVFISNNINEVKLVHYTTNESAKLIKQDGFKDGSNNVLGEGVYFTNKEITGGKYQTGIEIKMRNHKQLFVENDFDIYKEVSNATGKNITNGFQIKDAMLKEGFKSMRVKQEDGSFWTVVFDKKVIKIIK